MSLSHRLMPAVLHALTDRKELLNSEIYLLSAVTALQRVTETLPHFISPYLQDTTLQVTHLWTRGSVCSQPLGSLALTLPVPAGVSGHSARRDLLFGLLFLCRPALPPSCLPEEHPGHQAAPQGPTAHPHQELQQHGGRSEGGWSH